MVRDQFAEAATMDGAAYEDAIKMKLLEQAHTRVLRARTKQINSMLEMQILWRDVISTESVHQ